MIKNTTVVTVVVRMEICISLWQFLQKSVMKNKRYKYTMYDIVVFDKNMS